MEKIILFLKYSINELYFLQKVVDDLTFWTKQSLWSWEDKDDWDKIPILSSSCSEPMNINMLSTILWYKRSYIYNVVGV